MKNWVARTKSGAPIITVPGETKKDADAEVERQLKGRPGGRHEYFEKWVEGGRTLTEER